LQRSSAAGKAAAQPNKKLPQASEHSDPNLIDSATETKNSNFQVFQQTATADYTIKLIAPAAGEKLVARGRLVRSGRTLSVTAAEVYAVRDGNETLCATALATIRNFEAPGS
jgi:acyl-coenzyme A thioesterase PaaI-like protein